MHSAFLDYDGREFLAENQTEKKHSSSEDGGRGRKREL
jgi:hypothetical protein